MSEDPNQPSANNNPHDENTALLNELAELSYAPDSPSDLRDSILTVTDAEPPKARRKFPQAIAAALTLVATLYAVSQLERNQPGNLHPIHLVTSHQATHADPLKAATQWLQAQQATDGGWHGHTGYDAQLSTALTALALTSLIDVDATSDDRSLRQAEQFLFRQRQPTGITHQVNVLSYDYAMRLLAMVKLYKHTDESYIAHAITQAIDECSFQLARLNQQHRLTQRVEAAPLPTLWLHEAMDHAYRQGFDQATTARSVLRNQLTQANVTDQTAKAQQWHIISVALGLEATPTTPLPPSAQGFYWTKSPDMRAQLLKGQTQTGALASTQQWEPGGDIMATALTLMAMSDTPQRAL